MWPAAVWWPPAARRYLAVAQLDERHPPKVKDAGSSPVDEASLWRVRAEWSASGLENRRSERMEVRFLSSPPPSSRRARMYRRRCPGSSSLGTLFAGIATGT